MTDPLGRGVPSADGTALLFGDACTGAPIPAGRGICIGVVDDALVVLLVPILLDCECVDEDDDTRDAELALDADVSRSHRTSTYQKKRSCDSYPSLKGSFVLVCLSLAELVPHWRHCCYDSGCLNAGIVKGPKHEIN